MTTSEYARQVWKDRDGNYHSTEAGARISSRRSLINDRFDGRHTFGANGYDGVKWFLQNADGVVELYKTICAEVDAKAEGKT